METDLFPDGPEGGSSFPLDGWMLEALSRNPEADGEALAHIANLELRRECFVYLMDFRSRGRAILAAMAEETHKAISFGRSGIGGIRLAGAIWNRAKGNEVGNELAGFYVLPLSILYPELAPFLVCEGSHAQAMKKAGWRP